LLRLALVTIALFLAGVAAALALGRRQTAAPVVVHVTMADFRFTLSRHQVPVGTVKFMVVNRGATVHDFSIGHAKTRFLQPGKQQTITVRFAKAGRYAYKCTVGGHAKLGMKGTFVVGNPKAPSRTTSPTTTAPAPTGLQLTPVGAFDRPDLVTAPPGDTERVFVVEQKGVIRVVDDGVLKDTPFLDISDQVQIESETGLLGLAFAPDYTESGLFYVFFNRREANGNLYLEEFRRSATDPDQADPYSGRVVLRIVKPWENHNAGMLQFGPDGYLYLAVGDGDSGVLNPPGAFAQTLDDLLGNVLRIDPRETSDEEPGPYSVPDTNPFVGVEGARPEIWAYGFRNPWRFWIDPKTGDLLVGDVGEGTQEEIDLIPAGTSGQNFGWPCFEGIVPFDSTATCPGAVAPILDYNHSPDLCSVIGGVTLQDPRLPSLDGAFLYGDLCGGEVRALRVTNGAVASDADLKLNVPGLDSFGTDALGRVYAVSFNGGVFRIDPASSGS
jgi:glucose/arabinose dehydrogenase